MSTISNRFRKGWFSDPENWHGNYRMQRALMILETQAVTPVWNHGKEYINNGIEYGRVIHVCTNNCTVTWPEWVTDEVFDQVYALADSLQTLFGAYNQKQAYDAIRTQKR